MKAGAGKQKGAAFERFVCRKLSEWISDRARDDLFWRSAMSGGRAAGKKDGIIRPTQTGDISSLFARGDEHEMRAAKFLSMVVAECKFLAEIRFESFVLRNKGPIIDAWDQCVEAGSGQGRQPFLVIKQNWFDPVVITERHLFDHFEILPQLTCEMPHNNTVGVLQFDKFIDTADATKIIIK